MNSIKQIIVLSPGFPTDEQELDCIPIIQNLVSALATADEEIQVKVISFQYPFTARTYLWNQVEIIALGGKNSPYPHRFITWSKALHHIHKQCKNKKETILLAMWLTECAWIGSIYSRLYNIPLYAIIVGQDSKPKNKYLKILPLKKMKVIGMSQHSVEEYSNTTGHQVDYMIPLGLDCNRFNQLTIPADEARDIDIIGVGSLSFLKNYLRFVKIVHRLIPAFPTLKTVIVGGNEEQKADIVSYIQANDLADHITLTGAIDRMEVIAYLHRSKLFLHTSTTEGQAYVFFEALYAGLHCVTTDVGRPTVKDRMWVGNTDEELIGFLTALLRQKLDHSRYQVPSTQDTARQILNVMSQG